MGFIRVRAAQGPLHEFDVSESVVAADPNTYVVIDSKPVAESRPATYVFEPVKPVLKKKEA